ncbi:MAG: hypothetical protein EBU46_21390, partial [Nitrosomonadaceae bacterium]|nr:hypothetical protein [Nitrosomonadaceae bacterium]
MNQAEFGEAVGAGDLDLEVGRAVEDPHPAAAEEGRPPRGRDGVGEPRVLVGELVAQLAPVVGGHALFERDLEHSRQLEAAHANDLGRFQLAEARLELAEGRRAQRARPKHRGGDLAETLTLPHRGKVSVKARFSELAQIAADREGGRAHGVNVGEHRRGRRGDLSADGAEAHPVVFAPLGRDFVAAVAVHHQHGDRGDGGLRGARARHRKRRRAPAGRR